VDKVDAPEGKKTKPAQSLTYTLTTTEQNTSFIIVNQSIINNFIFSAKYNNLPTKACKMCQAHQSINDIEL